MLSTVYLNRINTRVAKAYGTWIQSKTPRPANNDQHPKTPNC